MNKIVISVIVPVYKAELYLHRSVDSLLAQTFTNFEILLIDDGSPDKSGQICDEYALQDSRIRVIHKPNGGVASARQCGIEQARGEYTIHVDPDDWVETTMLEELYVKAKSADADMVICDFYVNRAEKQILVEQNPLSLKASDVLCNLFQHLHGSCCNKLIRLSCYDKYKISFPQDLSYCEDLFVCCELLLHDIKVAYLHKAFYHYVQNENENSLVKTRHIEQDFLLMNKLRDILSENLYQSVALPRLSCTLAMYLFFNKNISSKTYKKIVWPYKFALLRSSASSLIWRIILFTSVFSLKNLMYQLYIKLKPQKL